MFNRWNYTYFKFKQFLLKSVRERVKINQDVLEQSLSCLKIKIYYLIKFQVKNTLKNN